MIMKRILFLLPIALLTLVGCQPEPKAPLPDPDPESYQVTLEPTNSGLDLTGATDLANNTAVNLAIDGVDDATYNVEIGAGTYYSVNHNEMMLKSGSYFKSVSTYHVDRLIVDFYEGQLGNFSVYANANGTGSVAESHESTSISPNQSDGGKILEYSINSTGWMLKNIQNKAGIYSITVIFSI